MQRTPQETRWGVKKVTGSSKKKKGLTRTKTFNVKVKMDPCFEKQISKKCCCCCY